MITMIKKKFLLCKEAIITNDRKQHLNFSIYLIHLLLFEKEFLIVTPQFVIEVCLQARL